MSELVSFHFDPLLPVGGGDLQVDREVEKARRRRDPVVPLQAPPRQCFSGARVTMDARARTQGYGRSAIAAASSLRMPVKKGISSLV